MSIPPHRLDELRALASALGRAGRDGSSSARPPLRRWWTARAFVAGTALGVALLVLRSVVPVDRSTLPNEVVAQPRASVGGDPPTRELAATSAPEALSPVNEPLTVNSVGTLLAAERAGESGVASSRRELDAVEEASARPPDAEPARASADAPPVGRPPTIVARSRDDDEIADIIARSLERRAERAARVAAAHDADPSAGAGRVGAAPDGDRLSDAQDEDTAPNDPRDARVDDRPMPAPNRDARRGTIIEETLLPDTDDGARTDDVPDLSGSWDLTNAIDATDHAPFAGLEIRFRVELEQRGDRIVGRGEKLAVDGVPLPPAQRTPIVLAGAIRGREVVVRFVEHGRRRASTGGFRWTLSPDGERLHGTFGSNAASSRGSSHARRVG